MTRDGPFVYPVAGLLGELPPATRRYPIGPAPLDCGPDLPLAEPVTGELVLSRTNRGLLVRADARTAYDTTCSRCLRSLAVPIDLRIDEEVLPSVELTTGQPIDTTVEPEAVRLTAHHELDLEPLVRDAIQLAEPIAPLCRPDCPGLCPVCGADLSLPGHVPHDEAIDPRLAALQGFRVDGEAETD